MVYPGTIAVNKRSGDLDPLREPGFVLGGERGDSTLTIGGKCGVDRRTMDMGRC